MGIPVLGTRILYIEEVAVSYRDREFIWKVIFIFTQHSSAKGGLG